MSDSSEWVSLRQAADMLGVHPATVRNWADKGDIMSRRTPGGHRRFAAPTCSTTLRPTASFSRWKCR